MLGVLRHAQQSSDAGTVGSIYPVLEGPASCTGLETLSRKPETATVFPESSETHEVVKFRLDDVSVDRDVQAIVVVKDIQVGQVLAEATSLV